MQMQSPELELGELSSYNSWTVVLLKGSPVTNAWHCLIAKGGLLHWPEDFSVGLKRAVRRTTKPPVTDLKLTRLSTVVCFDSTSRQNTAWEREDSCS